MRKLLLLFLLAGVPAWSACALVSGTTYRCASTGNPTTDGDDLYDFLDAKTFPCGSTIILDAGASYNAPVLFMNYTYGFRFKAQTGCSGAKKTQLISSRLNELPAGQRVSWADREKMARLVTTTAAFAYYGTVVDIWPAANNWAYRGLTVTTSSTVSSYGYAMLVADGDTTINSKLSEFSRHMEFDRCLFTNYEEEQYGPMETATAQAAFFRSVGLPFKISGRDIAVENSMFKGFGGYDPTSPVTISASSATQASPAVVTATGIATTFGLSYHATCATGCTDNCSAYGGCKIGVFGGATGNWSTLNGAKMVVYNDPDSVKVYVGDAGYYWDPTPYDGTGKGSLTGTVSIRRGSPITPVYAILVNAAVGFKAVNNFIEGWTMTVFTAGGTYEPTDYRATVQAGSTSTSIILDNVAGLRIGDLIAAQATGYSVYCTNPVWNCHNGGSRVGQVTGIAGTTATVAPYGPQGFDVAPTTGGWARWRGHQVQDFTLRRNTIFRSDGHTLFGKGPLELKSCDRCLIDGNTFTDSAVGNWFVTSHNQAGSDPWTFASNLTLSNNLAGGPNGANPRLTLIAQDNENSSDHGENVYFRNNVLPEVRFPNASEANPFLTLSLMDYGNGTYGGGFLHNTMIAKAGSSNHKAYYMGTFNYSYPSNYLYGYNVHLADNLMSYGESLETTNTIPGFAANLKGNLFWSDGSVSAATIESTWANNEAVELLSDIPLAGTCNWANWENCKVADGSSYKGTATDGGDPGADIAMVKDHLNGWSERAGLIDGWNRNRSEAIKPAGTKAVLDFRLVSAGACTVELYTNRNRATLHGDTPDAAGKACGRTGNLVEGDRVVFVLGNVAGLTAGTEYFYKITQGTAVMVGSFRTTANAVRSVSVQVSDTVANNLVVEYSTSPDFSGSTTTDPVVFAGNKASVSFTASSGAAVYYRWKKRDVGDQVIETGRPYLSLGG